MAILRILFIIILAYYLVRFLDRYVVPYLFGKSEEEPRDIKDPSKKEFRKKTRQGDVTITDFREREKQVKTDNDDYVDYEEL